MAYSKKQLFIFLLFALIVATHSISNAQTLMLHYSPSNDDLNSLVVTDISGNNNNGNLKNGAKISEFDGIKVIDLEPNNGYVDLGSQFGNTVSNLKDFTIFCKIYIPSLTDIGGNGNFIWAFSNSTDIANDSNGCLFFSAKNSRYAISPTKWTNESGIETGAALQKGEWKTIAYSEKSGSGNLYIDGVIVATGNINMQPNELGKTNYNYLGRSCYSGDAYLKNAKYADFRIYDGELSSEEISKLSGFKLNSGSAKLLAEFDFSSTNDSKNKYIGILENGAKLSSFGNANILDLGENNGYFNLSSNIGEIISTLDSFSISTNLFIPTGTATNANGNFIWTFANSDNMAADANGNMFLTAISSRYAISTSHWSNEFTVNPNTPTPKGRWINITYTQYKEKGFVFIDGLLKASNTIGTKPKELNATTHNFLGRSCYAGDVYLKNTLYSNFRIYEGAIDLNEIEAISNELIALNRNVDSIFVHNAMNELTIENKDSIRSTITLPKSIGQDVELIWSSSNLNIVTSNGSVSRPPKNEQAVTLTLTATLSYNNYSTTKEIEITVLPYFTEEESVDFDLSNIKLKGNLLNVRTQILLSHKTNEGSVITWKSNAPDYINSAGRILKLNENGEGKKQVTLTATVTKGNVSKSKDFTIYIAEYENRTAYLFSYFTGNSPSQEQIRFAISYDGFNYIPLNNGKAIISSSKIANKKAVRDPHILRAEDGKTFYMVVTDMKSSEGWSSNRGMVLLKSTDLVNWSHSAIHFPSKWPSNWGNIIRVWAPQTIYDPEAGKYMVYFSLLTSDGKVPYDKIFYCYANEDFTDLEGEPQFLFDRGSATIDGDIVFNEENQLFNLFYKNEGQGGICKVTSPTLTAPKGQNRGSQWSNTSDNLEQTNEAVEGAGVFRLINTNRWVLMYDCYGAGHYQFCTSTDLENFQFVMDNYAMDARHGTTISISKEEADRLVDAFPSSELNILNIGASNINIRERGITVNKQSSSIKIPLYYGANLKAFDPLFFATPGTKITPTGPQDFTKGSISYQFNLNGTIEIFEVETVIEVNPILPDFHADPEVMYSEKTGLFYIYPTTDGYSGWGGYSFDVFSSADLVNWSNEGTFLDLSTNQVSWASGNAWAPCIEEKKLSENDYRYYFYYSGNAGNRKKIGVAVSNNPIGPFVDSGSPMINQVPSGTGGQIIDGDVFTDPVSGKSYFYYGNGFMAVAELNEDMISIKEGTSKIITPKGGTLSTYAYREGAYVFYREGIYYFLWSVDDTGSSNYHVAYGTSNAPSGPINIAENPIVIKKDASNSIYGTAHNSIIQIPGKDEWYIVYHRINKNFLSKGPGYHREVCIDRMFFNENGTIEPVIPTHRGIDPVNINENPTGLLYHSKNKKKGQFLKQEYFTIYGQKTSYDQASVTPGIYLLVKYYKSGAIESQKVMFY